MSGAPAEIPALSDDAPYQGRAELVQALRRIIAMQGSQLAESERQNWELRERLAYVESLLKRHGIKA